MSDEYDRAAAEFHKKSQELVNKIAQDNGILDKALLKAAFFCEGKAKENYEQRIYQVPIPLNSSGKEKWKRTGMLKAGCHAGMNPGRKHEAIIYNTAPYAARREFGYSSGDRPTYAMSDAIFKNKDEIRKIISVYMKENWPK